MILPRTARYVPTIVLCLSLLAGVACGVEPPVASKEAAPEKKAETTKVKWARDAGKATGPYQHYAPPPTWDPFGLPGLPGETTTGPVEKAPVPVSAPTNSAKLLWLTDLDEAQRQAASSGRPVLVRVLAGWCPVCRATKKTMEQDSVRAELAAWTLVHIDVTAGPTDIGELQSAGIPALFVRTAAGRPIASRVGGLAAEELVAWLRKHRQAALAQPDRVLLAPGAPDGSDVAALVRQFDDRDPAVREAAIRRLAAWPDVSRGAVIKAFRDGRLSARLAAMDVLRQWQAPVEGMDPWRPDTLSPAAMAELDEWADELAENTAPARTAEPEPPSEEQLAEAREEIDRLLAGTDAEAWAVASRLATVGRGLLPEVAARLARAETDHELRRLRMLRYRLLAGDALVLRWPGGLARLADTDPRRRQEAAEELVAQATAAEASLLAALCGDADPMVREIGLRGLQAVGGAEATAALANMLSDPEPNVRAAVLKQLEERPQPAMVPKVAEYLAKEKDADLIVHAVRFLRVARSRDAMASLLPLLKHDVWQVRAEAAAAVGEAAVMMPSEEKARCYAALIKLLGDDDAFVVSRAVEGLSNVDLSLAVEPMMKALGRHPELAGPIIQTLARKPRMRAKALPRLLAMLKHEDPKVRAAVITMLAEATLATVDQEALVALRDPASEVRVAAAGLLFNLLDKQRDAAFRQIQMRRTRVTVPLRADKKDQPVKADREEPNPYEVWLAECYAGQHRPPWMAAAAEPLLAMLGADEPKEQAAAASALIPLGRVDRALPVLRRLLRTDRETYAAATKILPWLTAEYQSQLFDDLSETVDETEDYLALFMALTRITDRRTADTLWKLLGREDLPVSLRAAVQHGLIRAYLGERFYVPSLVDGAAIQAAQRDAEHWIASGNEAQRAAALALLARAAPDDAIRIGRKMLGDPSLPADARRHVFRVLLSASSKRDEAELVRIALDAVRDDALRGIALAYLAGDHVAVYAGGAGYQLQLHLVSHEVFTSGKPIAPKPPPGLRPQHVRAWIDDKDAKTAAYAGYLLALMKEHEGLPPLLAYWNSLAKRTWNENRLVVRAVAALNDSTRIPELRKIYKETDRWRMREFYWTVRSMTGPAILKFRKEIRDEVGMANLR